MTKKTTASSSKKSSSAPTAIAALRSRKREVAEAAKKSGPEVVKSSFAPPPPVLPELGPATSAAELDDLLAEIDKEIALDPELTQDLLDILNDEDEEMVEDEDYDEPQGMIWEKWPKKESKIGLFLGAVGYTGPLPDYIDDPNMESEFYSCDDDEAGKEFSGDIEDDPEMAEMLKMLEAAKGDLEGAKEEDLAKLMMENFDNVEETQKAVKRKSDLADQVVPEMSKSSKEAKIADVLRPVPAFIGKILAIFYCAITIISLEQFQI